MKKLKAVTEVGFFLVMSALLLGCGKGEDDEGDGGETVLPPTTGTLVSITLAPSSSAVPACTPVQFSATANYSDGSTAPATDIVQWGIDLASSGVAQMSATASGVVIGFLPGMVEVHANSGYYYGSAVLNVTSAGTFSITGPASAVAGSSAVYAATATCSGYPAVDVSNKVIWDSSNKLTADFIPPLAASSGVAEVGYGIVSAVAAGPTNITATFGSQATSNSISLQVQ
ncbi:MAG: hypothetical protein WC742_07865 [Gallionellaceae bacterium]|jgi:hypothetical protein